MTTKILLSNPYALHDSSSDVSKQMLNILIQLRKRGCELINQSATVFDSPQAYEKFLASHQDKISDEAKRQANFSFTQNDILHNYQLVHSYNILAMNMLEMSFFINNYNILLNKFRPDLVLSFGDTPLNKLLRAEAKRYSIPNIFYLSAGTYLNSSFDDIDLLVSDSQATAQYYAQHRNLNVQISGPFIFPEEVLAKQKAETQYVTIFNPNSTKGIMPLLRLILMAKKDYLNTKFLIVQKSEDFQKQVELAHLNIEDFTNVEIQPNVDNIQDIYAKTKVLLSFWFDSWARGAAMNAIPAISPKNVAFSETIGESSGTIFLDLPEKSDYNYLPTENEMRVWYQAMQRLLNEPDYYTQMSAQALEYAKHFDIEKSTDRLLELMNPFIARKASLRPKLQA